MLWWAGQLKQGGHPPIPRKERTQSFRVPGLCTKSRQNPEKLCSGAGFCKNTLDGNENGVASCAADAPSSQHITVLDLPA
jgi:hypothetical protein